MKQQTIGRFFSKKEWYSICSAHQGYEESCICCNTGRYINVWGLRVEHLVKWLYYPLWFWWVNRHNSKINKFLEETFPNLKKNQEK